MTGQEIECGPVTLTTEVATGKDGEPREAKHLWEVS